MSVRHALLAILTEGSCYGYQLRAEFSERTGTGTPLNVGQIYNTLDRLERDGLVVKGETDDAGHVPYTITPAGHAEVATWLTTSVAGAAGRDELLVKVTLALSLPEADARTVITVQRAQSHADLEEVSREREAAEARPGVPLAELLALESREASVRARLSWLDAAERRITEARTAGIRSTGLAAARRRGRPSRRKAPVVPLA